MCISFWLLLLLPVIVSVIFQSVYLHHKIQINNSLLFFDTLIFHSHSILCVSWVFFSLFFFFFFLPQVATFVLVFQLIFPLCDSLLVFFPSLFSLVYFFLTFTVLFLIQKCYRKNEYGLTSKQDDMMD